jgi:hypothetical protein
MTGLGVTGSGGSEKAQASQPRILRSSDWVTEGFPIIFFQSEFIMRILHF